MNTTIRAAAISLLMVGLCDAIATWPPSKCTHVEVLNLSDTDQVSWRFEGSVTSYQETATTEI